MMTDIECTPFPANSRCKSELWHLGPSLQVSWDEWGQGQVGASQVLPPLYFTQAKTLLPVCSCGSGFHLSVQTLWISVSCGLFMWLWLCPPRAPPLLPVSPGWSTTTSGWCHPFTTEKSSKQKEKGSDSISLPRVMKSRLPSDSAHFLIDLIHGLWATGLFFMKAESLEHTVTTLLFSLRFVGKVSGCSTFQIRTAGLWTALTRW